MQKLLFLLLSFATFSLSLERRKYDPIVTTKQEKRRLERRCPMPQFVRKLLKKEETQVLSADEISKRYGAREG